MPAPCHARRAGAQEVIVRYAPVAARAAAAAGAHREAVEHYRAGVAAGKTLAPGERAELLEGLSVEAYLCDRVDEALAARRTGVALREELGDRRALGDSLRWLARLLWWSGSSAEAEAAGREAVRILAEVDAGRELAMALSGLSQLQMLAWNANEAIELGMRAIELARSLDDTETVAHALTNVGTARAMRGEVEEGRAILERVFALADAGGFHDHAARALAVHAVLIVEFRQPDPQGIIDRGIVYAEDRQLDAYRRAILGVRAARSLDRGAWDDAEADALEAIGGGGPGITGFDALVALGRLQARRGEPSATATLDRVQEFARRTGELQRRWPAAAARAEHAWLAADLERLVEEAEPAYEQALVVDVPWVVGELAFWLWRAGALAEAPAGAAEPYRLSIEGDWRGAAAAWEQLESPYARAEALSHGDEDAIGEALAIYARLGARAAADRLRADAA